MCVAQTKMWIFLVLPKFNKKGENQTHIAEYARKNIIIKIFLLPRCSFYNLLIMIGTYSNIWFECAHSTGIYIYTANIIAFFCWFFILFNLPLIQSFTKTVFFLFIKCTKTIFSRRRRQATRCWRISLYKLVIQITTIFTFSWWFFTIF